MSLGMRQESRAGPKQRDIVRSETDSRTQLDGVAGTRPEGRKKRGENLATQPKSCPIRHTIVRLTKRITRIS